MDDAPTTTSMDPVTVAAVRGWLREKESRGVKQVYVTSVLSRLAESVPPEDDVLVGTAEAATLLGVERPRIAKLRRRGIIPPPLIELASGPVWLRSQVVKGLDEVNSRRRNTPDVAAG
jgi:hypothetical protein